MLILTQIPLKVKLKSQLHENKEFYFNAVIMYL